MTTIVFDARGWAPAQPELGRYEQRLYELAAEVGAELRLLPSYANVDPGGTAAPPSSDSGLPMAQASGWRGDQRSYLVALHELGHVAHGHVASYAALSTHYSPRVLEAEAEAWVWALEHLDEPLEAANAAWALDCLGSYQRDSFWYGPEAHVKGQAHRLAVRRLNKAAKGHAA